MSKVVAVIAEYNPFHNGHKYQIDKIREEISDATIIAIMSGNIVQRGDFAFADKYARAKMAINCGIDAVFELPFPYACSTAEIFASAGIEIASSLGADYLYFGIESEDLKSLEIIADTINSQEFENQIELLSKDKSISYPVLREKALSKMGVKLSNQSNDMLAVEYIRAIKNKKLSMEYRAIKREGAGYKDSLVCDLMSASAIRNNFYKNGEALSVPRKASEVLNKEISLGKINDREVTNRLLLSSVLLSRPEQLECVFDVPSGMGYYLYECAKKCKNPTNFTDDLSSKNYTTARLKRAVIYNLFNVQSIDKSPDFTILLGANEKGRKIISLNKNVEDFTIITKHSDAKNLSFESKCAYEKCLHSDEMFATLCIKPYTPDTAYKQHPYIS